MIFDIEFLCGSDGHPEMGVVVPLSITSPKAWVEVILEALQVTATRDLHPLHDWFVDPLPGHASSPIFDWVGGVW